MSIPQSTRRTFGLLFFLCLVVTVSTPLMASVLDVLLEGQTALELLHWLVTGLSLVLLLPAVGGIKLIDRLPVEDEVLVAFLTEHPWTVWLVWAVMLVGCAAIWASVLTGAITYTRRRRNRPLQPQNP